MSHRSVGQLSLADQLVKRRAGQNEGLVRMAAMVQWRPLERALGAVYNASEGRPSYPPLVMFKCLLLQQWYTLSDPQLEEALADRLSFRRFAGLPWTRRCPTIPPSAAFVPSWRNSSWARACSPNSTGNWQGTACWSSKEPCSTPL
jgi:Transposase domain (DUF772)